MCFRIKYNSFGEISSVKKLKNPHRPTIDRIQFERKNLVAHQKIYYSIFLKLVHYFLEAILP